MKLLILFLIFFANFTYAKSTSVEHALETQGIKVEFSDVSQRGFIYPRKCELCTKKVYEFKSSIKILKKNQPISFTDFLVDYPNAKYPTLFLDPKTLDVVRVIY